MVEMTAKGYILVEGHGEVEAAQNLIVRVSHDHSCFLTWSKPLRWKNLQQWAPSSGKGGVRGAVEFIRSKADVAALLILCDEDDACPKDVAPDIAGKLSVLNLEFPVAYVLLHPEYEVLFLPCLDNMKEKFQDGRSALMPSACWDGETLESRRGVKEWLSKNFPDGRRYKPSIDQLPMTQKIDLQTLRKADVPCFGSLERAVQRLCSSRGQAGVVYP